MDVTKDHVKNILLRLVKMDKNFIDEWFDKPAASFGLKTPNEMLDEGRGAEVITVLTKLLPNGRPNEQKRGPGGVRTNERKVVDNTESDNIVGDQGGPVLRTGDTETRDNRGSVGTAQKNEKK